MRPGTQNIMLKLCFDRGEEEVNRQVVAHMQRDETNETVLDVLCAFAILSASQWPGSAKFYRLFVRVYAHLWSDFLETLPAVERAEFALEGLRVMGAPLPESVGRVVALAQRELETRGIPAPIQ